MEIITLKEIHVQPKKLRVRSKTNISISFSIPKALPIDSIIVFRFRGGRNNKNDWYYLQPFDNDSEGYFNLKSRPITKLLPMLTTGKEYYIQYRVLEKELQCDTIFDIELHDTLVQSIMEDKKRIEIIIRLPNEELLYVSNPPTIKVVAAEFDHISLLCPSMVKIDEEFKIILRIEDKYNNLITDFPKEEEDKFQFTLIYNFNEMETFVPKEQKITEEGIRIFRKSIEKSGLFKIRLRYHNQHFDSNLILCAKIFDKYKLFWGYIHGHTRKSDGMIGVEDYFRNLVHTNLDFGTCTEHDRSWETSRSDFQEIKNIVKKYNKRDDFVSFFGYEWGTWFTGGYGDICIYHYSDDIPIFRAEHNKYNSTTKLNKNLRLYKADTLLIGHHTALRPGYRDWDHFDNEIEKLVEIYSCWGNQEYSYLDGNPLPPRYKFFGYGDYAKKRGPTLEKKEGFVQNALERGYKLGFTAGGDDHYGFYPSGRIDVDNGIYPPGILAVWAKSFTKKDIWKALRNRRCYGTTGVRIIVEFRINGHFIGDVIRLKEEPQIQNIRDIRISIFSGKKVQRIDLVKNKKIFAQFFPNTLLVKQQITDDTEFNSQALVHSRKAEEFIFYYLRIFLEDNEMAWISPIWIIKDSSK